MSVLTRPLTLGVAVACVTALSTMSVARGSESAESTWPASGARTCAPPPGVTCILDVPYAGDTNPTHTLDVYYPTGKTGEPSVLLIHGGGWKSNNSQTLAHEGGYFAENGFAAFSINYTLSTPTQPSWPRVFDDVKLAREWVRAHAADYGARGDRVGAFGPSAGGHLSALLDTKGPEDGHAILTAVSLSGPMDLGITYREGGGQAALDVEQLLGCVPGSCPNNEDVDGSPISHVTSDDGSLLFFNSDGEVIPVSGAYAMNDALQAAHVPHTLVVLSGMAHARAYECRDATVLGQTSKVIDDAVIWLGKYLLRKQITPTGTYCTP